MVNFPKRWILLLLFVFLANFGGVDGVCTRVVDGDTIVVVIGDVTEKVRLIGVDTPETVHPRRPVESYGPEASSYTRLRVEERPVTLEFDQEERDRYGRLLAYVFVDGMFLNADLVDEGYGRAYTRFPFRYRRFFVVLEGLAQVEGRGLWEPAELEDQPSRAELDIQ